MADKALTLEQFREELLTFEWQRRVVAVHLHHTETRSKDWRGQRSIEAMRKYHKSLGWGDIAQHLTVAPDGLLWTGRNWNRPPASNTGDNGSSARGPFMIEVWGDFDIGSDVLKGVQRLSTVSAVAFLHCRFLLPRAALNFHRELGSPKTCPGTSIDKDGIVREVGAVHAGLW